MGNAAVEVDPDAGVFTAVEAAAAKRSGSVDAAAAVVFMVAALPVCRAAIDVRVAKFPPQHALLEILRRQHKRSAATSRLAHCEPRLTVDNDRLDGIFVDVWRYTDAELRRRGSREVGVARAGASALGELGAAALGAASPPGAL